MESTTTTPSDATTFVEMPVNLRVEIACEHATDKELDDWLRTHPDEVRAGFVKKCQRMHTGEISVGWLDDDREIFLLQEVDCELVDPSGEPFVL